MIWGTNFSVGRLTSGIEHGQIYRGKLLNAIGEDYRFLFVALQWHCNMAERTAELGFDNDHVVWLYSVATGCPYAPSSVTVRQLVDRLGNVKTMPVDNKTYAHIEMDGGYVRAYYASDGIHIWKAEYFVKSGSGANIVRADHYYGDCVMWSDYFGAKSGSPLETVCRRFYSPKGNPVLEIVENGKTKTYFYDNQVFYSEPEFVLHILEAMRGNGAFSEDDIVLVDRFGEYGAAMMTAMRSARLACVVHAEHFVHNARDFGIAWNNYYEWQFIHRDKFAAFITSTERQREKLSDAFATNDSCIVRPIYTVPVGGVPRLRGQDSERRRFGLVTASRWAVEKRFEVMIRAVARARRSIPELTLDIYGGGGEEKNMRDMIHRCDAESYIQLKGFHDMAGLYSKYEAYLSASLREGFGLSMMEAMAEGLGLVGFDCDYGCSEFIREGWNGVIAGRGNMDATDDLVANFADAIVRLFSSCDMTAIRAHAYETAERYLDGKVAETWRQVLCSIRQS